MTQSFLESAPVTDQSDPSQSTRRPSPHGSSDKDARMSFGDHLDELRVCLIRALVGVMLGTVVCLIYGKNILAFLCTPLLAVQYANGLTPHLQALSPTAVFTAYLKIGFLSGLILTMPWVIYQIWVFVATGLYSYERRFIKRLIPASMLLFVIGVMFLYYIVLPIVLHFFISFNKNFPLNDVSPTGFQQMVLFGEEDTKPLSKQQTPMTIPLVTENPVNPVEGDAWVDVTARRLMIKTANDTLSVPLERWTQPMTMHSQFAIEFYISFVLMLALAFGIAFETPIVVFFLAWSGIVTTATMCRSRRYVLLGMLVISAVMTPPDVISQILLAGPMYMLFELGILIARIVERKSAANATA